MRPVDLLGLALEALAAHRTRYGLSALAVAVGVAAVVLLASIGEGTRRFIAAQMSAFGTTVIGVHPGRVETFGVPGAMGGGARPLTLDDARASARLPGVVSATPAVEATAEVELGALRRRVMVFGVGGAMPRTWSMRVGAGRFLPDQDWERGAPLAVLGPRLARELAAGAPVLGRVVRIGNARFRVVGVMEPKGSVFGFDLDDVAYVPVANAMRLFHRRELSEVNLMANSLVESDALAERARLLMIERHRGDEDVTIVTQRDALRAVDGIMTVVTGTVTAIAAISLLVGAIGIFTILWIVVHERVQEIGLVQAVGATRGQVLA
jgi:putative ABC transport system permease protein